MLRNLQSWIFDYKCFFLDSVYFQERKHTLYIDQVQSTQSNLIPEKWIAAALQFFAVGDSIDSPSAETIKGR